MCGWERRAASGGRGEWSLPKGGRERVRERRGAGDMNHGGRGINSRSSMPARRHTISFTSSMSPRGISWNHG